MRRIHGGFSFTKLNFYSNQDEKVIVFNFIIMRMWALLQLYN